MKIIDNIKDLKQEIAQLQGTIGLVPTMGALHEGHKSLIQKAVSQTNNAVVSVFVNPIQFGANEDLDKYPRTLEQDALMCAQAGVKILFAPKVEEMYGADKNNLTLICPPYFVVDKGGREWTVEDAGPYSPKFDPLKISVNLQEILQQRIRNEYLAISFQ